MTDERAIREMVRQVVYRTVGMAAASGPRESRPLVTQREIQAALPGDEFTLPDGALVTPLARQAALERKIKLVGHEDPKASRRSGAIRAAERSTPDKTVALGADHGGFQLKELLKQQLRDLGYPVTDCGTDSSDPVDYPDFALAVARLVAEGSAWRGILVDGAGIGSCMAANKVPGVRAAMCYDEATAVNSRKHNDANVLTLGAGLIGPQLVQQIVKTWLSTPSGGGRHARRVDKIMAIEGRFSRS
jgi:ribose 5-phosphate isomerase B